MFSALPFPATCGDGEEARHRKAQVVIASILVWTNLLDNAVDALGGKGEITIRTRREGESVVVEIEDNGPGIPEDIGPRIFDPFFTTKAPGKGTGLGLSISHSIVTQKHSGELRMESRPGCTRFTVRLPIVPRETAAPGSR
jgi:signal transduction histidine kinase